MTGHINDDQFIEQQSSLGVKNHASKIWYASIARESIAAAGLYYSGMIIGSTPVEMLTYIINTASSDSEISLYEGSTYSGGTLLPVNNMNRIKPDVLPAIDAKYNVIPSVLGTKLMSLVLRGTGAPSNFVITSILSESSLIMKPNTTYMLEVVNNAVGVEEYDASWLLSIHDY